MSLSNRTFGRALLVAIGAILLLASTPAHAVEEDDCYPGGCQPPTTAEPTDTSCSLGAESGVPGSTQQATVTDATSSPVRILFDGNEVGRGSSATGFRPLGAATIEIAWTVPADVSPGSHEVVATGPDFSVRCLFEGEDFAVLAVGSGTGTDGDGDGALAFTGRDLLLMVAIALALILLGYVAVRTTRRRRTI